MKAKSTLKLFLRSIKSKNMEMSGTTYNDVPIVWSTQNVAKNGEIFTTMYTATNNNGRTTSTVFAIDDDYMNASEEVRTYALHYQYIRYKNPDIKDDVEMIEIVNRTFVRATNSRSLLRSINAVIQYPIDNDLKKVLIESIEN